MILTSYPRATSSRRHQHKQQTLILHNVVKMVMGSTPLPRAPSPPQSILQNKRPIAKSRALPEAPGSMVQHPRSKTRQIHPLPPLHNLLNLPTEPLRPAWDDLISISCQGRKFRLQIAALNTSLQAISRAAVDEQSGDVGSGPVYISFPAYEPLGLQSATGEDGFDLRSECLVHLAASDADTGGDRRAATDSICLFLYQVSCTLRKLIQPLADRF